ncbi:MAG: hypothetical protein AB1540_08140 [Bdellovibrionota bacterium]
MMPPRAKKDIAPTHAFEAEFEKLYDQNRKGLNVFYREGRAVQLEGAASHEAVAEYLKQYNLTPLPLGNGLTPVLVGINVMTDVIGCGCPSEFSEAWIAYFTVEGHPHKEALSPAAISATFSHVITDNPIRQGVMAAKYGTSSSKASRILVSKNLDSVVIYDAVGREILSASLGKHNKLTQKTEREESDVIARSLGVGTLKPVFYHLKSDKMREAVAFVSPDAARQAQAANPEAGPIKHDNYKANDKTEMGGYLKKIAFIPLRWSASNQFKTVMSPALPLEK